MTIIFNGTTGLTGPNNSDGIVNGVTIGKGGGNVSTNSILGDGALNSNINGSNNTALGYQAGYSNTTGEQNVYIGGTAGFTNSIGSRNTIIGWYAGNVCTSNDNVIIGRAAGAGLTTGGDNTFIGARGTGGGAGYSITTGSKNTIIGQYTGNQNDLDIRTGSNNIILSQGDGIPKFYMSNNGTTRLFNAYENTLTSNSKGGTVTILPRDVFFPPSYFNVIDTCTIVVNCVASEGTAGGLTRTDILHVNYRFGYNITSLASNMSDGVSVSNWTYSFDSNGLRVTQNWGASGSSLGTRWTFFITGCLFQG
jgi:hypothetical protein